MQKLAGRNWDGFTDFSCEMMLRPKNIRKIISAMVNLKVSSQKGVMLS
jgi:hypothetical protein